MDPNNSNNTPAIAGALTYPGGDNVEPEPVQPRQPQNLQGLLRFAMEARQEDPPAQVELSPMDNQRREFLEQALHSMVMDVMEVLRHTIPVLRDAEKIGSLAGKDEISSEVKNAFDSLADVIEDVDVANDFCKVGGFDAFDLCYNTRNSELWIRTNDLLAGVCQNFPQGQALALERGLLKKLLERLQEPQTKHKEKFIYALSCCVREYEPGCRELISLGGCEVLVPFLEERLPSAREEQHLKTKAACLLRHLIQHYPLAKEKLIKMNLPAIIVPQIDRDIGESTEHLLNLLRTYCDNLTPAIIEQCKAEDLELRQVLQNLLATPCILDDEEQNREIIEYATEILMFVCAGNSELYDCEEEADR